MDTSLVYLWGRMGVCCLVWHQPTSFLYVDKSHVPVSFFPSFPFECKRKKLPVTWAELPAGTARKPDHDVGQAVRLSSVSGRAVVSSASKKNRGAR